MTTTHAGPDGPASAALADLNRPADDVVLCDACPVLCRIRSGKTGACDRYGNVDHRLTRMDPLTVLVRSPDQVRFAGADWPANPLAARDVFPTGIGASTTYPDYKPAPFIVGAEIDGVDMVTVVSEGIFSYCGLKVKIDTDRHLGPETAAVRAGGEQIGHVTTAEYGSQMLRQVLDLAFRERNCGFVILEVESDAHGDMNRRSQIEKRNRFYMVRHGALQLTGVNYTQRVAYQEPIPMNLLLFVNPVLPRPEPEDLFSRAREIFGESLISVSDPGLSATLPCQD